VEPEAVQGLLLGMTSDFLDSLAGAGAGAPVSWSSQRLLHRGVTAYVLDPASAARWRGR
jgi:hypothetical protein